uniref:Spermidine synthase n=1 Tax=Mayetiola destructor TaxID=39758 RepID=A0A0B4RY59_MAYDE|nr:spermidine synthase [Mayetiola destructor]
MDTIRNGWFSEISEEMWPGQCFSLRVKNILHEERSQFQDIKFIDTEAHGKTLVLDGVIQCTEKDEFSYQEMISFIPLCIHPNPENVLIVGGGDGGVAREVVKHPGVKTVHQVEIDGRVVELSKQFLPNMACGFDSPKVTLTVGDGFEFMKQHSGQFDVIITDSSDPVGPAESLFQEPYFVLMKNALKPNGIICSQGGSYWIDLKHVKSTLDHCRKQFAVVGYAVTSVPSYPCGQIGFVIGSLNPSVDLKKPHWTFSDTELDNMNVKYYSSENHRAAFDSIPRSIAKQLNSSNYH